MKRLMYILKNKFCKHRDKELISWNFCHYPEIDHDLSIKCLYHCNKCGSDIIEYIDKNTNFEKANISKYWAKRKI